MLATETNVLDELVELVRRLPVPDASWHPYVVTIRACKEAFEQHVELAAVRPDALDRLERIVEDEEEPHLDPEAAPAELREAVERLASLPRPEGRHPFLDEILPALDAMQVVLAALL